MGAYEVLVLALAVAAAVSNQVEAGEACAGCSIKQDPRSFPVEKLNRALALASTEVTEGVAKVLSVSTQVVAGVKYIVVYESASGKTCTATWVDAPWQSKLPLDTKISCRAKRSSLSAFQDVDESEVPQVKTLVESAANQETNEYRRVVVSVAKAQKRVVHGVIYKVKYMLQTTGCKMEDVPNNECLIKETAPKQICETMVFTSPYLTNGRPHVEVMNTECKTLFISMFAASGKMIDGNDENELSEAETYAVQSVNERVNSIYYKGLYKMESVEEKMQAGGKIYNFKFLLRDTDCLKEDGIASPEKCNFVSGNQSEVTECAVSVWLWPWSGLKRVEAVSCHSASGN